MVDFKAASLNLVNISFYPEAGDDLCGKLSDCYRQLLEFIVNKSFTKELVVKQSIFFSATDFQDYLQNKQKLFACASKFFTHLPPTSLLSQSPDNASVVLEISLLEGAQASEITLKKSGEISWCVFRRGTTKLIFAAGLQFNEDHDDLLVQSTAAFGLAEQILLAEELAFSDILRQWNYIAQITRLVKIEGKVSQHYQIFNDVRSKYYGKTDFENGYPAATGIGMDWGGVIIDFIAGTFSADQSIGIKSPVQFDAYTYSKEVLAENCTMNDFCRTTPKFERAKLVDVCKSRWIFISGTAAIVGQDSDHQDSVEHQTGMAIDNIKRLIAADNVGKYNVGVTTDPKITYLRVYVKYDTDFEVVRQICRRHFPEIPLSFVIADVCRPELLVEIEGHAVIG